MLGADSYLKELKTRSRRSRVYRRFQLIGLQIAELLQDEPHKTLYIKLAKERDPETLLRLAKSIAENGRVKNRGAYFMTVLTEETAKKNGKNTRNRK